MVRRTKNGFIHFIILSLFVTWTTVIEVALCSLLASQELLGKISFKNIPHSFLLLGITFEKLGFLSELYKLDRIKDNFLIGVLSEK